MIYNLFSYPNTKRLDENFVYLAICYFLPFPATQILFCFYESLKKAYQNNRWIKLKGFFNQAVF